MPATPFFVMLNVLKTTIAKVSSELLKLTDIREALARIDAYTLDLETLPKTIADLTAEKAKVDARLPQREAAAKPARSVIRGYEENVSKLRKSLEFNLASLADHPEPETSAAAPNPLGEKLKLPATRRARIEELKTSIAEIEAQIAKVKEAGKKAESLLKSDTTRSANLGRKLEETKRTYRTRLDAVPEMAKLAKKTGDHLKNRQAHRDRRAGRKAEQTAAEVPAAEAPKAPTDEDLRRKAEQFFGQSVTDDQLAELRDDPEFLNF